MVNELFLRVLQFPADENLLRAAWGWQFDKPRWWRESMRLWKRETVEDYAADARRKNQVDLGIFSSAGAGFSGLITLIEINPGIFETHIDAPRGTELSCLIEATLIARDFAFAKGAKQIFNYTVTINRPMLRLCRAVGFRETNTGIFYGSIGEKLLDWREMVLE